MRIHTLSETIDRALRSAGLDTRSGPARRVVDTIRSALAAAGIAQRPPAPGAARPAGPAPVEFVERVDVAARAPARTGAGFFDRSHTGPAGTRAWKLYVPARARPGPMPLVVMLHGCKQNPDDFAAGTRMNALAEQHGFLVAYPAQSRNANGSNCWNWFRPTDQARAGGEPEVLAGIVRDVIASEAVDPQRVFVTGLSAGAAMAVILGHTHPELFRAVGAHSGLPHGAAHDVGSAFAAMRGGSPVGTRSAPADAPGTAVPTIVFHGDRDSTVAAANATAIVEQAVAAGAPLRQTVHARAGAGGREFTRTVYADAAGQARVEHWLLHDAGHAWSGGDAAGSYTDAAGPDASAEMIRFFGVRR
ncbi:MAG: PHB depolymerase family esterase [Pseudomonadota bacterium]